ncbi:MAG: ABC transporter permease [Leptolyngbya sp. PLA3]|nr:MAG: ABC transporter permease [Cyanobacteria bacterium CYA]MCE7968212.1 ABC transporter permease [Leptolyngbya sp. PL-A3]
MSRQSQRWWSRLFGAQESGLTLVIIAMGIVLTLFGGHKQKTTRQAIAPGETVRLYDASGQAHEPGTLPDRSITRIVITSADGRERSLTGSLAYREASGERFITVGRAVNRFLELENVVLVMKDASFIAVMAVGMTGVIILAGIDLSVGSIYAMSAIVGAIVLHELGSGAGGAVAVAAGLGVTLLVGAMCGLANGVMIVGLRVHPFVITLGMMAALRGLTIIIPQKIYHAQSIAGFPPGFTSGFFKKEIAGVYPVPVIIMLLIAAAGWFVLTRTVLGRRVFAIGGNETAARYAGIPVGRVKIIVYAMMGLLAGLSSCMYLGYLGSAETGAGTAYELKVIAAAVIGGASLMGGRGSALGAVLGAIVIQLIDNAMIIFQIDQNLNQVVMGAAIIIAVVIDQAKRRIGTR